MIQILFEPTYKIGDRVALKLNPEKEMVVDGYSIFRVNSVGEVIHFKYSLYDETGTSTFYFADEDLTEVEVEH